MALNNTTANAVATSICSALNITDPTTINAWKSIMQQIYSGLKTDIVITIAATSITTNGSASTQVGPPSPIPLSPA